MLVSVNVGLPRDVEWNGRTVRTGIWKSPVSGRCRVGRLNLQGDGQGDLAGHGGEQRAVFVYQLGSYRYWQEQLKRTDFVHGQFGENFTVDELSDDAVCIGDRYQIGTALFEITQPRVTCYRVGIRMNEPRMPALLTSSGRPGFYFRVLREGDVGAGDDILKVAEAAGERMTVAEINALLYSRNHARGQLERALRIDALSPGWRASFEALLQSQASGNRTGNAGLMPAEAAHPVASGFKTLVVTSVAPEGEDVVSLTMEDPGGQPLGAALPGQYVVVRFPSTETGGPLFRSYSLSGPLSSDRYRISVKIEPNGAAGRRVRDLSAGDRVDVSLPRGSFTLVDDTRPVVLLSAGIGVTPVLAMLYALADVRSARQILWLHQARDRQHHAFGDEARRMMSSFARGRSHVCYSRPAVNDQPGRDFDSTGHLSLATLDSVDVPPNADVYLCGPPRFMADIKIALAGVGVPPERIHVELFNGSEAMTPGVVGVGPLQRPHAPKDDPSTGTLVSFARSGVAAHWSASYGSLLELAEACDVPVRWSCRSGVCHSCESGLVSGDIAYDPEPLDPPADGNLLVCCSHPTRDVVVDL